MGGFLLPLSPAVTNHQCLYMVSGHGCCLSPKSSMWVPQGNRGLLNAWFMMRRFSCDLTVFINPSFSPHWGVHCPLVILSGLSHCPLWWDSSTLSFVGVLGLKTAHTFLPHWVVGVQAAWSLPLLLAPQLLSIYLLLPLCLTG